MKTLAKTDESMAMSTEISKAEITKRVTDFNVIVRKARTSIIESLYARFSNSLDLEDIEDVFQEGCCIAWEKWNSPEFNRSEKGLKGFLYMVCRNIIGHNVRSRRFDINIDELLERLDKDEDNKKERFDIDDESNNSKTCQVLHEAIRRLSETDKDIIYYYYWEDMKLSEIAKAIGYQSSASVKTKKCNCIKKIREMMLTNAA